MHARGWLTGRFATSHFAAYRSRFAAGSSGINLEIIQKKLVLAMLL